MTANKPYDRNKTHCSRGHEFTPENTYTPPDGHKRCRACRAFYPSFQKKPETHGKWWELAAPDPIPPELPTPDCFEEGEWAQWLTAAKAEAIWSRDKTRVVKKAMCEDCIWSYQKSQMEVGKCAPPYEAITPLHRLLGITEDEQTAGKPRISNVRRHSEED